MTKAINVINVSGNPFNSKEWETGSKGMAMKMAGWLADQGCTVAISLTDDGVPLLDYGIDGRLQPTIRVDGPKIIWPSGSDFDLMMKFLTQEG